MWRIVMKRVIRDPPFPLLLSLENCVSSNFYKQIPFPLLWLLSLGFSLPFDFSSFDPSFLFPSQNQVGGWDLGF